MSPRALAFITHRAAALILCLLAASTDASAQGEQFVPYTLKPEQTSVRVWTSGDHTHARVNLVFNDGGYRVAAIGPVTRQGNNLSVDFTVERWTGGTTLALVYKEYFFDLGTLPLEPGNFTFTVKSSGSNVRGVTFDPRQIVERWEEASLERNGVTHTVTTVGEVTFAGACLNFPDTGYRVVEWHDVVRAGNDFSSAVKLERFTGRAEARRGAGQCRVFVLGANLPPDDTFTFTVRFTDGVAHTSHPFTPAGQRVHVNPVEHPAYFVRQHYLDFLNREPDNAGLNFWYNEIANSCGGFFTDCIERKRTNTSGAFYLSIEFQGTGFFVYRLHKAATGSMPRFDKFMAGTREVGRGVVVGAEGWQDKLDANKQAFVRSFVARPEFAQTYPESMSPEQFVNTLNVNTAPDRSETEGGALSQAERDQLANGLRDGTETRATVLRKVAEDAEFNRQEKNRAFVLMQYFGYLRRNPDDAPDNNMDGYNFWLRKLNNHGGDFQSAEMVRSFLVSQEYRRRFRQN